MCDVVKKSINRCAADAWPVSAEARLGFSKTHS
jgi:hypothetical protein